MNDEVLDTIVGVKVTPKYMSIINEVTHDSITWWYWLSPLRYCLRADDELFHVTLYSWLLNHPDFIMRERLIQVLCELKHEIIKLSKTTICISHDFI